MSLGFRMPARCESCSTQGEMENTIEKWKTLLSFPFQVCGQLQISSTCSTTATACSWIAWIMGKEQRYPQKSEGECGAVIKALWISYGHPGDSAFGRGSTLSLKRDFVMPCCGMAASRSWRVACVSCFLSGRNLSSEGICKSISHPSQSLWSRSAWCLFMLLVPLNQNFTGFTGCTWELNLWGYLVCHSLCCCCPWGRAPLPCNLCFIVPLLWVASGGESQTSPSPPLS